MCYPMTREVFELFTKPYRQTAEITFNGVSESIKLTEKNLRQGGLTVTKSSVSGDKVEIGSAICASLTLVLDNRDGRFDSVKFEGAELFVRVGIKKWDAHRWEKAVMHYVPLGYFTVDESPRKLSEITLSALDRMAQFDKPADLSALGFPMSLYQLVSKACEVCRVPLGTTAAEMLNADYIIFAEPQSSGEIAWRQIIQRAAEISGSCAYIDREGRLRFGWYEEPEGYCPPITPADRFSGDLFENVLTLTGVSVEDDENIYLAGAEGYTLDVSDNFLLQHDHAAVAKSIWQKLSGFSYTPFSAQIKSLPHYDPLDVLGFIDKSGEAHRVIVTDAAFTLNGSASLEGRGETKTSGGYAALDPLTQRERDILSKMEKKQSKELSSREQALIELNNVIWNSLGLHATTEESPDGGKIYYYHDGETLEASTIIYTFRAGGFAWTNRWEGDKTVWQYGFTRDGNAVVNALSAFKIQAEQIEAGAVTAEKISVEFKNDIESEINAGLGDVRQEFTVADGVLKSEISEEITDAEARLGSKIEQTAEKISLSVEEQSEKITEQGARLEKAEASIEETAGKISLKVDIGDVSNQLSLEQSGINIKSNRLTVESDNFKLSGSGEVSASGSFEAFSAEKGCSTKMAAGELSFSVGLLETLLVYALSGVLNQTSFIAPAGYGIMFSAGDRSIGIGTGGYDISLMGTVDAPYGVTAQKLTLNTPYATWWRTGATLEYNSNYSAVYLDDNLRVRGTITQESAQISAQTANYGARAISSVASCAPVFSDMGSCVCDETGVGVVALDPIFCEAVELPCGYRVFITQTGEKAVGYVSEKTETYFTVKGEPGAEFDWAVYIPQKNRAAERLEDLEASVFESAGEISSAAEDCSGEAYRTEHVCESLANEYLAEAERLTVLN